VLAAGTTYWITTQTLGDYYGFWHITNPQLSNGIALSNDGTSTWVYIPNNYDAAFRVNGASATSVPEPSSFALLTLGGFGLAISVYHRRKQTTAV
jgi:hypothetical protein